MKWISFFFIATSLMTSCYSQNNQNKNAIMDNEKKSNPVYSKTDTTKVVLKDEDWKKMLDPEVFHVARQKERKDHSAANLKVLRK